MLRKHNSLCWYVCKARFWLWYEQTVFFDLKQINLATYNAKDFLMNNTIVLSTLILQLIACSSQQAGLTQSSRSQGVRGQAASRPELNDSPNKNKNLTSTKLTKSANDTNAEKNDPSEINVRTDAEAQENEDQTAHNENDDARSAEPLRGIWQLVGVSCPDGATSTQIVAQNQVLTSGSERTFVHVKGEGDETSYFQVDLKVSPILGNCQMTQSFQLTYQSPDTVDITTTSEPSENCSAIMDAVHVYEGEGYSFSGKYQVFSGEISLQGRLPIRMAGTQCSDGEPAYRFVVAN